MSRYNEMEATDPAWNANNSEILNVTSNESDFDIAITPSACPGTVDINIVDIGTKVTYSDITYYKKDNSDQGNTFIENYIKRILVKRTIQDMTNASGRNRDMAQKETTDNTMEEPIIQQTKHMLELTESELQSLPTYDLKNKEVMSGNHMFETKEMQKGKIETIDDLDDIDIEISLGICPGTIDIDIVDRTWCNFNKMAIIWRNGTWTKQYISNYTFEDTQLFVPPGTHTSDTHCPVPQVQEQVGTSKLKEHKNYEQPQYKCTEATDGRQVNSARNKKHRFRSNSGDYIISCNGAIDVDIKPTILDEIDSQIPRIAPRKLKHVQFDVPKWNKYYSNRVQRQEKTNIMWMECVSDKGRDKLQTKGAEAQPDESTLADNNSRSCNSINMSLGSSMHKIDTYPKQIKKLPPPCQMSSNISSAQNTSSENRLANGQVYYKREMSQKHDVSDTYTRTRHNYNTQRSPQNKLATDKLPARQCIIRFSEEELVYRAEHEAQVNVPKQSKSSHGGIIVMKKGQRLDPHGTVHEQVDDNRRSETVRDDKNIKSLSSNVASKYQSQTFHEKPNTNGKLYNENHMNCTNTTEREARKIKEYNDAKQRDIKNKKRRNKSKGISGYGDGKNIMKGVPRTRIEKFQRDIDSGIVRPIFTKHRSGGLKRMKLQRELHHGSFATTFKGEYINEDVAVTVYSEDVNNVDLLQLIQLNRSNFVLGLKDNLRGSGTDLWLIHKFMPLGDLQHVLGRDPRRHVLGERHARFITAGLLLGLDYLHQNNVIHGNLKPSKILFNNQGFPVLTGFRAIARADSREQASVDVYTLAYSSPGRLRGDRDPTVDIFSLGCIAYEVVTGRTPFDGYGETETRENILNNWYSPAYDPAQFSFAGELFIDSCLRKHKQQRFTVGRNLNNMKREEWFSSIDMKMLKRQTIESPLLEAFRYIQNGVELNSEQKYADYNWGSVMDVMCPYAATMVC